MACAKAATGLAGSCAVWACIARLGPLLADEEQCGLMVPALMLYHEHDEDPELRSGPIGPEKRRRSLCRCWPASLMPTGTFGYIDNSQRALSRTNLIAVQGKLEGMTCVLAVPGENTSAAVVE